ncbi:G-protein coupled receptor Mth-like [Cloeon dipterum]|uniref:G-protein coupled receptor Mth-like n=1 Tax=Cloeon dipterum TaxID=197152 RepID=UPI00321F9DCF
MKASILTLVLVLGLALAKDLCKEELRTKVQGKVLLESGILVTESDSYPAGTFWKAEEEEGHWWVCPCLLGNCIRICDKEFVEEITEALSEYGPVPHYSWDEIVEKDTPPIESFKQIHDAKCDGISDVYKEDVRILANGKMRLENESRIYDAEDYCIDQMEGENSIHLVHCLEVESEKGMSPAQYDIYTFILLLSSIFLILTVVAYIFSPQIESFHRKSVIFYAAYHAAAIFTLAVSSYFSEKILETYLCFLIGFIGLYLDFAAMFWLNSMCIYIFFAYKGILRAGSNYFAKFAAYSTGLPILIVAVALIFNLIDDEDSIFNPNMEKTCWVTGKAPAWIYGFGPSLIVLLANVGLLAATWASGEPVRTTEETDQTVPQEKERRRTYLILTLLEGCTFIDEALPYIYDGAHITFITSVFVALQGVFIFLLLVCADRYVRKSLSSRFCKSQRGYII